MYCVRFLTQCMPGIWLPGLWSSKCSQGYAWCIRQAVCLPIFLPLRSQWCSWGIWKIQVHWVATVFTYPWFWWFVCTCLSCCRGFEFVLHRRAHKQADYEEGATRWAREWCEYCPAIRAVLLGGKNPLCLATSLWIFHNMKYYVCSVESSWATGLCSG